MANNTTRVLNLTPLTFRNGLDGAYLRPLEQGVEWPSGKISLFDEFGGLFYIVELKGQDFIIDPDFFFRNQWYQRWPNPYSVLEVQNNSGRFVNTYRLAAPNGQTEQMQSIPPGKNLQFNARPSEVWSFRATFTNELVGIARIGFTLKGTWGTNTAPDPTLRLTLTDEFVQNRREYLSGAAKKSLETKQPDATLRPSFTPRHIIGEKRESTPPPDAQEFLTATTVRSEFSKEAFNGRKNRAVRHVEIAGALLKWGSKGVLANYHGEDKDDIQSLTIYADRMEVADHLRFPGTKLTIYARELAFVSNRASIDTTPRENLIRACSKFLTKDPEDPTNANFPADKAGNPTYAAKDGDKGEQGGTVTLYVGEVFGAAGDAGKKRFISRGGKGQEAEAGGLKKYVAKPGHLATYAKSQTFTVEDVMRLLELHTSERTRGARTANRADYWRWPGGETWPDKMGFPTAKDNPLRNGTAVAVKLLAYSDNPFYAAYLERGFLPGDQYDLWGGIGGKSPFVSYEDKPNPAPRPCHGRDAYAGGWPGDAGDGGQILFHLERGQVPDSVCDVGPGEPGKSTKEVIGGKPPGPVPAYDLTISIVLKSVIESHEPTFTRTEVTGKDGNPAKARKIVVGTEVAPADCEVKQSQAQNGSVRHEPAGDQSWAHPNVVCAVLRYARTAYRNGFRDEAAAALDPYYALIGPNGSPKSTIGADGKPKPVDERLRMALVSVTAMRNNLIRNLDYYGKPPGWVPRLNALSNINVLHAVRETAYETFYFADKLLRDYDTLDDAREVSQRMSDALKVELDCAKKTLQEAYDKIPKSVQELMDVQIELDPIKKDIEGLQRDALAMTEGTLKSQRIYSAAMQILGGIAKSLPVGQPFVGLAGSAFDAASQVDWNAEDPLKTARSAIDSFGNDVTKVMEKKKEQVAGLLTKKMRDDLRKGDSERKDAVTYLTGLLDDATKEPEDKAKRIEEHWKNFKVEERTELAEQIEDGKARIKEIDQLLPELSKEIVTLKRSANDAAEKLKLKNREEEKEQLEKDRTRTLQALNKLETHVVSLKAEKSQRLTAFADYRSKLVETEEEALKLAEAVKPKNKEEAARRADARREKLDGLKEEITAAKEGGEKQKELLEKRKETINEVMTNLEGLGDGLKLIGNGIVSLVTPLTPADPTWKRLAEQMLDTDPGLKNRAKQLEQKMCQALAKKTQKVEELFRWQQAASASIATITSSLGTLSELSQQRESIDQGLNPAVKGYLEETKDRARDILAESIYWFVKSYQYEFLEDVEDTFYNFDAWTEKLIEMERTKARAAGAGGSGSSVGKAETDVLTKTQFKEVGDGVYKKETLRLGAGLLRTRQTRGEKVKGDYKSCIIERPKEPPKRIVHSKVVFDSKVINEKQVWMTEMLDRLLQEAQISFNFVTDFEKGSFELNDARVVDVQVTAFEIKTRDSNLTLTIRVVHSGQSVLAKRTVDGRREFFAFQSGKDDQPIFWQFQYNQSEPAEKRVSPATSTNIVTDNVKALFFDPKDQSDKPDFKDYSPGLFSDYRVEVTGPKDWRSKVESIDKLVMNVKISEAP